MSKICSLCGVQLSEKVLGPQATAAQRTSTPQEQFADERFFPLRSLRLRKLQKCSAWSLVPRALMFEDYYYLSVREWRIGSPLRSAGPRVVETNFVVDVGSNDGVLLRPLKKLGVRARG